MPIITVEMKEGRTVEQKRQLVEGITSACVKIGAPAEKVRIILRDIPRQNFAVGGKLIWEEIPQR